MVAGSFGRLVSRGGSTTSSAFRLGGGWMAARWKSTIPSFESETVRKASTMVPSESSSESGPPAVPPTQPGPVNEFGGITYPPIPPTIKREPLPIGYEDEYFERPHLLDPQDKTKRTNSYLILAAPKFILASAARSTVLAFIYSMSASADVLALGTVEVELANIPEGSTATIKWRGKPVFIRHRTDDQIRRAEADDNADLRDPEPDSARVKDPKWCVVLGVCTHLGCVPVSDAGDYGGWFCPCHGSHYDVSGRIRKGPAPTNLEVPPYSFMDDGKMLLG